MTAAAPETPAVTPGQAAKSRVSVEATELNEAETGWVTAGVFVERDGEPDPDLAYQALDLNHGEMRALYDGLRLYYEQGIWSFRTVEREAIAARQPQPAPGSASQVRRHAEQAAPGVCPRCGSQERTGRRQVRGFAGPTTACYSDWHDAGQPAPDLAAAMAETRKVREQLAKVLGWFGDNTSGRYARVSGTVLARAYRDGGLTVPEELRRFL